MTHRTKRSGNAKAAYGVEREASYRAMCEQYAFSLGCRLVERHGALLAAYADREELLAVDLASRHPWFDTWEVLKERVPADVHARILRDAALGRL